MRTITAAALAAFVLDQATKHLVLYGLNLLEVGRIDVAPPFLRFVMAWNRGINFGILESGSDLARWGLVVLSVAISIGVFFWAKRRGGTGFMIGAGLVIGGAIGNSIDRIRYGAVADFLNMSCCGLNNPYVFNLADIAIFAGAGLLILLSGDGAKEKDEA